MAVVLLGGDLDAYLRVDDVLSSTGSIPFPKVPDPIFFGNGCIQHITVNPDRIPDLKTAANAAGMYVLTDRFGAQRQGPLQPNRTFTI